MHLHLVEHWPVVTTGTDLFAMIQLSHQLHNSPRSGSKVINSVNWEAERLVTMTADSRRTR